MIPPKRIEEIEFLVNNGIQGLKKDPLWASEGHIQFIEQAYVIVSDLLAERKQLVAIVEAVDKLRYASLEHGTWYTGCPCEFADDVDKALKAWKEEEC